MNHFNIKTLKRHIRIEEIPADHLALLQAWGELIRSGRIHALKETALHGEFASKIVEGVLGYYGPAGGADYTVANEQTILRGSVDIALGRFGAAAPEILAPIELKGADARDLDAIMPGRNKSPVQQAWEYAMHARGVKWVLVSNMVELRLYGFGEGTASYEIFQLDRLTDPGEYSRFMLLLSTQNNALAHARQAFDRPSDLAGAGAAIHGGGRLFDAMRLRRHHALPAERSAGGHRLRRLCPGPSRRRGASRPCVRAGLFVSLP